MQPWPSINYQKIEESRRQRPYRNNSLEHRIEKLDVIGINADLRRSQLRHELNVGIDAQFNYLKSGAFRSDIVTNVVTRGLDSRYPDGSNKMNYAGIYAQHQYKIVVDKLILNSGLRLSHVSLNSVFKDTSLLHLPHTKAVQKKPRI
ncbi:TonB-dependent receptor [Dyadobacter sp. CY312]|nr:TonB-dependent receptor [Dyadobacter sp. CY312]MCE7041337.1 TonB-dependent receptor [Dyadobacter sp. CY312]